MFGMRDMFKNMGAMAKLAKDENFQKLMGHPKIQQLLTNKEFIEAAKSKDYMKLFSNAEFSRIMQDPEVLEMMHKVNKEAVK
ncbi:MAG: hypothetical protein JW938_07395 [Candidatus Omnitrophica bacterium]|nr:hypothetical protein [Candidatus Omnitrophota bacterium]